MAIEFNRVDILKYFIEDRNVDINVPNPGQTQPPIFMAIKSRHWEVIEYIVEKTNADLTILNARNETILFPIVRQGLLSFLEHILDQRKVPIDLNRKNSYGETVLHVAASLNRMGIAEYLIDQKHVDVDVRKDSDNKTALHYAALGDRLEMCQLLVLRGANANLKDGDGLTPLELAKNEDVVDYLTGVTSHQRRRRRHVDTLSPPVLLSQNTRSSISGDRLPSLGYASGGNASNISGSAAFHLESFLLLATFAMKSRGQSERYYLSPLSMLRSRMSSVAIDAVNGTSNF